MGLITYFKRKLYDWLKIMPSNQGSISIQESFDQPTEQFINKIWMRGDSNELSQLYHQTGLGEETFWGSDCSQGQSMRKIHTGLPKLMVKMLTNISIDDISSIEFDDEDIKEIWNKIEDDNDFMKLLKSSTKKALSIGDGAFKISYDRVISELPIIEFYSGEDVDFVYDHGRIREIIFYTKYTSKNETFTLKEIYGYGYIAYRLIDKDNIEVPLKTLIETSDLVDVEFDSSILLAIPYIITDNERFEGRGQSIFSGKYDAFDSLDECYSQWIDAFRTGKVKTYIPESLLPRDPATGVLRKYNSFDTRYIAIGSDLSENAKNQITTTGGSIQVEGYIQTYITALDLCLQGIISPSTLGIDVKKLDNGEAQREKEKSTLYTRNAIIGAATKAINDIIKKSFYMLQLQNGTAIVEVMPSFSFGEYANPSFESVVETMSNPNTPMSIEAKVEEIWGDSKDQEWKLKEVERIKNEKGIIELEEPILK